MLCRPSAATNVRPDTFSVRSVPGPQAHLLPVTHPIREAPGLVRTASSSIDRIGAVAEAGAVEEVLVLGKRHLRLRRIGLCRNRVSAQRSSPAALRFIIVSISA